MPGYRHSWDAPSPDTPSARLGRDFLADLGRDYREHGAAAVADFRKNARENYFRLLMLLVPTGAQGETGWVDGLSDERRDMLLKVVEAEIAKLRAEGGPPDET